MTLPSDPSQSSTCKLLVFAYYILQFYVLVYGKEGIDPIDRCCVYSLLHEPTYRFVDQLKDLVIVQAIAAAGTARSLFHANGVNNKYTYEAVG